MGAHLLSAVLVFLAEGQFPGSGYPTGEDQSALIDLVNDAMTSWWAQLIAIGMFAAIALLLFRSLRRDEGDAPPIERRKALTVALGVLVALAVLVVLAAALRPGPLVVIEFLIQFAVLVYLIVRNRAPVVLGAGAAIMWVVSPRRRREMRAEASSRPDARERGAALERVLDEAAAEAHGEPVA
jgi:uncharacterized protein YacL